MKTIKLMILCFMFVFFASSSLTQAQGMRVDPGMRMKPWKGESRCWKATELNLSPDQFRGLTLIQQDYFRETNHLRTELFSKHLELSELLKNPTVKMEAIRFKHAEIIDIQSKLEEKTIDYLIKVKTLLTQDQLKNWCPEQEIRVFRRMPYGHGFSGQSPPNP